MTDSEAMALRIFLGFILGLNIIGFIYGVISNYLNKRYIKEPNNKTQNITFEKGIFYGSKLENKVLFVRKIKFKNNVKYIDCDIFEYCNYFPENDFIDYDTRKCATLEVKTIQDDSWNVEFVNVSIEDNSTKEFRADTIYNAIGMMCGNRIVINNYH